MPKKTKKEKILAKYRKELKLLKQQTEKKAYQEINAPKPPSQLKETKTDNNIQSISSKTVKENDNIAIRHYFFKDFKHSLLISFFLIALEFFLYFAKLIK